MDGDESGDRRPSGPTLGPGELFQRVTVSAWPRMVGEAGADSWRQRRSVSKRSITMELNKTIRNIAGGSDRKGSVSSVASEERTRSFKKAIRAPFARMSDASKSAYSMQNQVQDQADKVSSRDFDPSSKSRKRSEAARRVLAFLDGNFWQGVIGVATSLALFGPDMWILTQPPDMDDWLTGIMMTTFLLFAAELVLLSIFRPEYRMTFYFGLDLVATVSLVLDIPFLWELFFPPDEGQDSLVFLRAGRLVRTGTRTTRALRFLRFVRFARMIRLVRLIKLFRGQLMRQYLAKYNDPSKQTPNKLGLRLADLLGKRVIMMCIVLMLALPYLEVQDYNAAPEQGLDILEALLASEDSNATTAFQLVSNSFMAESDLLFLKVSELTLIDEPLDEVRSSHMLLYQSATLNSTAVYDDTSRAKEQAVLNLLLTLLLTSMLAVSAFLFNRDVHRIVVKPIIKTTTVIRKLAKTLYLLTNDSEDVSDDIELETGFIDSIVDQLITFFNVETDPTKLEEAGAKVHPSSHAPSRASMALKSLMEETAEADDPLAKHARELESKGEVDLSQLLCFRSFEAFWADKQAVQYFKVFLTSEFAVESLLFVEQVDTFDQIYRHIVEVHADTIRRFVHEQAPFQINLSDIVRTRLLAHDGRTFDDETYRAARGEIFRQLERDNFPRFKRSHLALELAHGRLARGTGASSATAASSLVAAEPESDGRLLAGMVRSMSRNLSRISKNS